MKVLIDISQIAHLGGVANYTKHLTEELVKNKDFNLTFFYSSLRKPFRGNLANVKSFRIPPTILEPLFNDLRVPIDLFAGVSDIFHSSDWTQPKSKAKKITTYHDVIPIKYPKLSNPKIVSVFNKRLKIVEKEVDMIIAVSNATKMDLLSVSNIPDEKVVVIYEAADEAFKPIDQKEVETFKKKYNLPEDFLLATGGVGVRRNLENIKTASGSHPLVVTGKDLPFLTAKEMVLLYNSASVLVYTSFYEGFGLPILEAMQSGIPVVTSNVSSMAEIGADSAVLVNPSDVGSIKKGIEVALSEKDYYRKKGLMHAKKFSWQKCAIETGAVYKKLYESS